MTSVPLARMNGSTAPAAVALAIVEDLLNDRPAQAHDVITALGPGDASLNLFLREVINLTTAAMGHVPGTVWYAVAAPSPERGEVVTRYLAGEDIPLCALCAPSLTGMLAATTASLFREIHGAAAPLAWRSLREAIAPALM